MTSRLFLALCVALLGLFATQALAADYCLGVPFSVKETKCGGPIQCGAGMYCDKSANCVPTLALGSACEFDEECVFGSYCRGPEDARRCVAISGVGQPCTGDSNVAQPDCADPLYCNMTTLKCEGGRYGDFCAADTDCRSGVCTSGKCAGPVGTSCSPFGGNHCNPDLYCDAATFECATRLAVGASCTSNEQCVATALCLEPGSGMVMNKTCVARASVAAGGFCASQSAACASGLCYAEYCLAKAPSYCGSPFGQCPGNQLCLCGRDFFFAGYGKCGSNSCINKFAELSVCLESTCKADFDSLQYPNSCASFNCKAIHDEVFACNPVLLALLSGPTKK